MTWSWNIVMTRILEHFDDTVMEHCDDKNSESLYLAMKRFLGLSLDERCRMGSLGREKMCMEFKKEKVVGEIGRAHV